LASLAGSVMFLDSVSLTCAHQVSRTRLSFRTLTETLPIQRGTMIILKRLGSQYREAIKAEETGL
jgi:hypothetical protein